MKLQRYREIMLELGFEFDGSNYSLGDGLKDGVISRCHKLGKRSPNWNKNFYRTKNGSFATKNNRIIYIHTHFKSGLNFQYQQNISNVTEEELINELAKYVPAAKQRVREERLNKILTK